MTGVEDAFAAYYGTTTLHPLGLSCLLLYCALVLALDKKYLLIPLILAACTISMAQRISVAGVDLTFLRILLLVALARCAFKGDFRGFSWNRLDSLVVAWVAVGVVVSCVQGSFSILVGRLGWAFDVSVTYLLVRLCLTDLSQLAVIGRALSWISIPVALMFLVELRTGFNAFSVFGGVPAETVVREGKLRCQGPFSHPILAGVFWASCLPLVWVGFREGVGHKLLSVAGGLAICVIVLASASSTPIFALLIAALGIALYRFRDYRKLAWVSVLAVLMCLHLVMSAPVWHILARVDVLGGSTGWHRYKIIDAFFENSHRWLIAGDMRPMEWGVWEMRDVTNQYILEGLRGGLLGLLCFVAVFVCAFSFVGRTLRTHSDTGSLWIAWLIGVILATHCIVFLAVSYFGQMTYLLYMQLAFAGSLLSLRLDRRESLSPVSNRFQFV